MPKIIVEVPENCFNCNGRNLYVAYGLCSIFHQIIKGNNNIGYIKCQQCKDNEVQAEPSTVDDFGNPIKLSISGGQVKEKPSEFCEWKAQDRNTKLDKIIYSTSCEELLTYWGRYCQNCGKPIKQASK